MDQHPEKRKFQRYPCLVPMTFTTDTHKHPVSAHMVNFSEGGICLDTDTQLAVGTNVEVKIQTTTPNLADIPPFSLWPTRVCWNSGTPEEKLFRYNLGLRYVD